MKLLLASSEVHPYSKSGGLADMVGALAKFLGQAGHEVTLVTPLYRGIREVYPDLSLWRDALEIPLGTERIPAVLWAHRPSQGVTVLFVEQAAFFNRASFYVENGVDYPDNGRRFLFFTKCVTILARELTVDVVHVHDWQAASAALLIHHARQQGGWPKAPATCLTIHNLAYQGVFPASDYVLTNLPNEYFHPDGAEFYGQLNLLKAGIRFSDCITTVSPTYAREITTPEFGCGLDGVLRNRLSSLIGILNGVDYDEWKTTDNAALPAPFTTDDMAGKAICKRELQKEFGLPQDDSIPLFGSITRLTDQKGITLLLGALEEMLATRLQFVLLGSGDPSLEAAFRTLAARKPEQVGVRIGFNQGLSHRIEAGADFFLMPSRFEPCGLNQMYSQRYGTIPIVRSTGGLEDTVTDLTESQVKATGIKFYEMAAPALAKAIRKALVLFESKDLLAYMRQTAMGANYSWHRTTLAFTEVYERALRQHRDRL